MASVACFMLCIAVLVLAIAKIGAVITVSFENGVSDDMRFPCGVSMQGVLDHINRVLQLTGRLQHFTGTPPRAALALVLTRLPFSSPIAAPTQLIVSIVINSRDGSSNTLSVSDACLNSGCSLHIIHSIHYARKALSQFRKFHQVYE